MAITTNWNSKNKNYIEARIEDPFTLDEFLKARMKWHRMIKGVDYIVPIVLDMSGTFDPPEHFMRAFIAIHRTPHPRQGHIYVMGLNPIYVKLSKHLFDGVVDQTKTVKVIDSIEEVVIT